MARVYALTDEEERRFLTNCNERDGIIYKLGRATALRVSDILLLPDKVLEGRVKSIWVTEQKTKKRNKIYLRDSLRNELKNYADKHGRNVLQKTSGGRIGRHALIHSFKKAGTKAELGINIGTHIMRKKYAQNYMKKYKSLSGLCKRLNHSNEAVTALYCMGREYA